MLKPTQILWTELEKRALALLAEGLGNKEIAQRMSTSIGMVQYHISCCRQKINREFSRVQLALWWQKNKGKMNARRR